MIPAEKQMTDTQLTDNTIMARALAVPAPDMLRSKLYQRRKACNAHNALKEEPPKQPLEIAYEQGGQGQEESLPLSLEFIQELCHDFNDGVLELSSKNIVPAEDIHILYNNKCKNLLKKHKVKGLPKKGVVNHCYVEYVNRNLMEPNGLFDTITTNLGSRGGSGVLEVTTGLAGLKNSCKYDCHFCPNERKEFGGKHDISRSYLSNEGVFKAGLREDFDPYRLMIHRLVELETLGHVVDKIEWIIIGGTFHSYPEEYLDDYIAQGWRALNTFHYFSRRFQGKYADVIHTWVQNGGLHCSLTDIDTWDEIMEDLEQLYPVKTMTEYQTDNETARCARCSGLSIETRPDQISKKNIAKMREYGCTRIQLGIQHLDKKILQINNRDHGNSAMAIEACLNAGLKIDEHLMLDLPGSTAVSDLEYLSKVFLGNTHQADYCKLYYCLNLPFTMIRKWYNRDKDSNVDPVEKDMIHIMMTDDNVTYRELLEFCQHDVRNFIWRPYSESEPQDFRDVSEQAMMMIPPWTRCVRIQRDFCEDRVSKPGDTLVETTTDNKTLGFVSSTIKTNENQLILQRLKKCRLHPYEIRSREIGNNLVPNIYNGNLRLVTTEYCNGNGTEYYISLEYLKGKDRGEGEITKWQDLFESYTLGHVRLRIPNRRKATMLQDIKGPRGCKTGIIRELHVYGRLKGVSDVKAQQYSGGQGQGFGKLLMHMAEHKAYTKGCDRIVVISGVGVRDYYRRLGYAFSDKNYYMIKDMEDMDMDKDNVYEFNNFSLSLVTALDDDETPAGSKIYYQQVLRNEKHEDTTWDIVAFILKLLFCMSLLIMITLHFQ